MSSSHETPNQVDLTKGMTGSCLCNGITVILNQDLFSRPKGHICYCESCRKSTGCSGLNSLATTRDKVDIHDPERLIKTYVDSATDSGRSVERHFCSRCSSPIYFTSPGWTGGCSVPLGIFPKIPRPEYEFYKIRKMDWLPSPKDVKSFDMVPTESLAGREGT